MKKILIASLIMFMLPQHTNAATKKKTKAESTQQSQPATSKQKVATEQPETPSPKYSMEPLDLSIDKLLSNYEGHNLLGIVKKLRSLSQQTQKDEFETTAQFEVRKEKSIAETKLDGNLDLKSTFAFVNNELPANMVKYNADKGVLTVVVHSTELDYFLGQKLVYVEPGAPSYNNVQGNAVLLKTLNKSQSTYNASNAFGATTEVIKTETEEIAVAFPRNFKYQGTDLITPDYSSFFRKKSDSITFALEMQMSQEHAKKAKSNGRVLLIGKFRDPFFASYINESTPTRNLPLQSTHNVTCAVLDLQQIWFFDKESGEIYKKMNLMTEVGTPPSRKY